MGDRRDFMRMFENKLIADFSSQQVAKIRDALLTSLVGYDIVESNSELIPYSDTNEQLLLSYCGCLKVDGKSDNTIKIYLQEIRRFAETIGKPLVDVNVYDIRTYLAMEIQRGVSNRTISNIQNFICAFYKWAYTEGIIEKNPCVVLKPVKYVKEVKLPFSSVEVDALRRASHSARDKAIIELLLSSGVRASELVNLDISDISFVDNSVRVRNGKGGKDRITYMSAVASHHIKEYLKSRHDTSTALFVSQSHLSQSLGSYQLATNSLRTILKKIGADAGVKDVHPHRFRRSFATSLYNKSMDLYEIQRLMGHTDVSTTLIYISATDDALKASYIKHNA